MRPRAAQICRMPAFPFRLPEFEQSDLIEALDFRASSLVRGLNRLPSLQVISGLQNFNAKSVESVVKAANMGGERPGNALSQREPCGWIIPSPRSSVTVACMLTVKSRSCVDHCSVAVPVLTAAATTCQGCSRPCMLLLCWLMESAALVTGATLVDIACDAELVKLAKSLGKFSS